MILFPIEINELDFWKLQPMNLNFEVETILFFSKFKFKEHDCFIDHFLKYKFFSKYSMFIRINKA